MNPREYRRRAHAAVAIIGALALAYVAQSVFLRRGDVFDGAIVALVGGYLEIRALRGADKLPSPALGRGQTLAILVAILLVGAGMRLWDLASIPQGVWFDEAENGLVATRILTDPSFRPIYISDLTQLPALFFYYLAAWIALLGSNILAVRLASAALGLLTIPLLYRLGRELFDERVGLAAAFLLAVSRWHVNFSRFGMNGVAAPFFLVLALYFLARGLRTHAYRDFAIGGLAIGLGLNTYLAFDAAPLLIGVWLLLVLLTTRFRLLRADWRTLALAIAVALLVIAPLGGFALSHRQEFLERTQTASLFTGKSPAGARAALVSNVVQHVEMFNVRGDRNGRHNLAGAPELDDVTGALFLLGLIVAVARSRQPRYALLVLWLAIMLLPGILSLDFEAPQSYRSIGVVPVVALLAALPVAYATRALGGWLGRVALRPVAAVAAAGLLVAGYANFHTYWFVQIWDNATWAEFSTQATLIAREVNQLGPGYAIYMDPIFVDQPTIKFLSPQLKTEDQLVFDPAKNLPLREHGGVAVFVSDLNLSWIDAIRRDYPSAQLEAFRVTSDAPAILYSALISPDQVSAPRGLVGQYLVGPPGDAKPAFTRQDKTLDFDWRQGAPVPFPFSVDWKGTLAAPSFGSYVFKLDGPPGAVLKLDQADVVHSGEQKSVQIAEGTHSLEVQAAFDQGAQIHLLWQPPGGLLQAVPAEALYAPPVVNRGLAASYYPNASWSGAPKLVQVDPDVSKHYHLLPLNQPFTVEWVGKLDVPTTGIYRFGTQSIDYSWLDVDGKLVADNGHQLDHYSEGAVNLTEGLHDIKIRFLDQTGHSFIDVYWTPPGRTDRTLLPTDRLFPPAAAYPDRAGPLRATAPTFSNGAIPTASAPAPSAAPPALQSSAGPAAEDVKAAFPVSPLAIKRTIGAPGDATGQLNDPRDAAVDANGNAYVVDSGHKVVKKFDPSGKFLLTIGVPGTGDPQALAEGRMIEPVAAVVEPSGNLLVLDSETAWLNRFSPDGKFLGRFGGPAAQFYHPRGLALDPGGNIYVADAGTSHVVVFNPQGELVKRLGDHGTKVGQLMEPVGVAVDAQGRILVTDTNTNRLTRFGPAFEPLQAWAIPHSASVEGAHVALAPDGGFYLTDPDGHRVIHFDAQGHPVDQLGDGDQLQLPVGISVDPKGNVYVTDSHLGQVVVFGQ